MVLLKPLSAQVKLGMGRGEAGRGGGVAGRGTQRPNFPALPSAELQEA